MNVSQAVIHDETIAAVATPAGRGAIAVVRVSGADAHRITQRHILPWPREPRQATLCAIVDRDRTVIDRAVVTVYSAPRSFTGEDLVEISTHGGLTASALVMAALLGSGAREAFPGEFTRRAVLNGKLDLVQAEAIGDLIDATSRAMHSLAVRQLDGGLSQRIAALRDQVIGLEALIAYDIDFPEEDDGPIARERITGSIQEIQQSLDVLLITAPVGELIRTGATVVIAGAPNAGKSSLFNALLGSARAIVTDIPGTTRDAIEAVLDTAPWPLRLVDTAGLRETADVVEQIGVEVSHRYLSGAHIVLACGETDEDVVHTVQVVAPLTTAPVIAVRTKADIRQASGSTNDHVVQVSAVTGEGLSTLIATIHDTLSRQYGTLSVDQPVLTRARQRHAVESARDEIEAFANAWGTDQLPAPVAAVHLRAAVHHLEDVIGAVGVEDVFDRLFQTFCVGK